MKKLLLIALVLIGFSAKAQYFQHLYGTATDDSLVSGINLDPTVQGPGYFMAGVNEICLFPGLTAIPASFTDINGNVPGAPYFDREYIITNSSGGFLQADDPQVFEDNTGSGFGIIGRYVDPSISSPNSGVFYLQLDPAGNPIATFNYPPVTDISGSTYDIVEVAAVRENFAGDSIFVTGTAINSINQIRVFAMKIDVATGGLGWGFVYFNHPLPGCDRKELGKDIIESPWAPLWVPPNDVIIVGHFYDTCFSLNKTWDGLLMHIDGSSGYMFPHPSFIYGQPDTNDWFNCITVATDSVNSPPGYVIGGGTEMWGNVDFYVPRVDMLGNPFWISTFDYSWNPGSYNECFDIIERIDSIGKYTYYAGGFTENGFFGGRDAQVVKMDSMGMPILGGEFTFGGNGNDYGKALDKYNANGANPPDGLSTFGTWNSGSGIGGQDMYLVRSYYNGESGCNDTISNPIWNPGPPGHPPLNPDTLTHFDESVLGQLYVVTTDQTLCFNFTLPGGSNARVANPETGDKEGAKQTVTNSVLLIPNPSEKGNNNVSLKVETDVAGPAEVIIYDMTGKQFYKGSFTLNSGINQLPLDLAGAKMAAGMYSVVITSGDRRLNTMMMVK